MKLEPDREFVRCHRCGEERGYWDFPITYWKGKPLRRNTCKYCRREYERKNKKRINELRRKRHRRNGWNKRAYTLNARAGSGNVTGDELKMLWEKSKGICYYCGEKIEGRVTFDHYVPLVFGGENCKENLVVCCLSCNSKKGAMTGDGFKKLLETGVPF